MTRILIVEDEESYREPLVYQLTRSIQAIGRVGSQSWGGEMKYIIRFD